MFGYLRVQRLAADLAPDAITDRFSAFAEEEGYALAGVFVEQAHTVPAGLDGLIEAVKRYDARAVAVPTLEHLAVLGPGPPLVDFVQRTTGAQVLAMDPEPASDH